MSKIIDIDMINNDETNDNASIEIANMPDAIDKLGDAIEAIQNNSMVTHDKFLKFVDYFEPVAASILKVSGDELLVRKAAENDIDIDSVKNLEDTAKSLINTFEDFKHDYLINYVHIYNMIEIISYISERFTEMILKGDGSVSETLN